MTRENLIDAIYHSSDPWSCPSANGYYYKCNHACHKCAENILAKYEKRIYKKGYDEGVEVGSHHQELCKEERDVGKKDKKELYLLGCLYAISELQEKGSCNYACKSDGKWQSTPWSEIYDWILEQLNIESEEE